MSQYISQEGEGSASGTRLVLHFDVNKTIVMRDGRISTPQMLNSLLCECIWGWFVDVDALQEHYSCTAHDINKALAKSGWACECRSARTERHWHILSAEASTTPPPISPEISQSIAAALAAVMTESGVGPAPTGSCTCVVTFGEFLEDRTALAHEARKPLKQTFTDPAGSGATARQTWEKLVEAMTVPSAAAPPAACPFLPAHGGTMYYGIVPAFFRAAEELAVQQARGGPEFRLVFRSFGSDIEVVAEEWNLWCCNEHPLFELGHGRAGLQLRFDGTVDGFVDRRLRLDCHTGTLERLGPASEQLNLKTPLLLQGSAASGAPQARVRGEEAVLQQLLGEWLGSDGAGSAYTAALQDDYSYWAANNEACAAGKLLVLTLQQHLRHSGSGDGAAVDAPHTAWRAGSGSWASAENNLQLVQMFFDDNIERDRAHIVDTRVATEHGFAPVDTRAMFARQQPPGYLCKVHPHLAILDPEYYLKEIRHYLHWLGAGS